MANRINTFSIRAARDEDELEGALLPVATRIEDQPQPTTNLAIPIAHFEYDTAIAVERQQENIAYALPNEKATAIADDSRSRVKFAEQKGLIAAEAEKEAVRNLNRNCFSKEYHAKAAVQIANQYAKNRDGQGFQTTGKPPAADKEKPRSHDKSNKQGAPKNQDYKGGGYEVKEYTCGNDYETSDYDIQEYRSVYD